MHIRRPIVPVVNEDIYSGPLPISLLATKSDVLDSFPGDSELFDDQTLPEKLQGAKNSKAIFRTNKSSVS